MNQNKVTFQSANGPAVTFYMAEFPRVGEQVVFPFAVINGTVKSVTWTHTNEVLVVVG